MNGPYRAKEFRAAPGRVFDFRRVQQFYGMGKGLKMGTAENS
jgi:hypothetical protein